MRATVLMKGGLKDYTSEVSESSLWDSIRDYLTSPDDHAYGWTEVEPRSVVWENCRLVVLSHDKRW